MCFQPSPPPLKGRPKTRLRCKQLGWVKPATINLSFFAFPSLSFSSSYVQMPLKAYLSQQSPTKTHRNILLYLYTMNQIKYSAYALLLVLGISSVALFVNNLSSVPSTVQAPADTKTSASTAKKEVKNVAGKNLFQSNCQTCHAVNRNLTGPALAGVESRGPWADRKNLVKWVKNPAVMINENAYAKDLVNKFNGQVMPAFPQLSEEQIGSIFDYLKEVSEP